MSFTNDPIYVRSVEAMARALRVYLDNHPEARPLFVLGPPGVLIVAELSVLEQRVCRNDEAQSIVTMLRSVALFAGGREATFFMFGVVLEHEHERVPFERVSLTELGIGGVS